MAEVTAYDADVGRPRKKAEDRYVTPARSYRPPPELYERVQRKAQANGDTLTGILVSALEAYDREHPDPGEEPAGG